MSDKIYGSSGIGLTIGRSGYGFDASGMYLTDQISGTTRFAFGGVFGTGGAGGAGTTKDFIVGIGPPVTIDYAINMSKEAMQSGVDSPTYELGLIAGLGISVSVPMPFDIQEASIKFSLGLQVGVKYGVGSQYYTGVIGVNSEIANRNNTPGELNRIKNGFSFGGEALPANSYGYGNPNEASEYSSQNEMESLNDAWAPGGSDLYGYGNPSESPTNFGGTTDSNTNGWGMIDPGMGTWGGDKDTSLADLGDNGKLGDTGTAPTKFSSLNDTLFDTGSNYDNGAATEAGFYGVGGYGGNNEMETQNAAYNEGGSDLYGYGNTDTGAVRLLTGRHARRGRVVRPTGGARETSNRTAKVTHLIVPQALAADFITPMGSLIIRRSRRSKSGARMSPPSVPHAVYRHLRTAIGMVL